jgi:peroxiredoxin
MSLGRGRKRITRLAFLILVYAWARSAAVAAPSFVPRQSPEFKISEPSGKSTLLSSLKGKVVVMEFFFIQSGHCMRVASMLNKLNQEMGTRGFQALGVVFDPPNAPDSHGQLVGPLVDYLKLTYPVGYSSKADVDSYLNRAPKETLNIPQIMVIDRSGMIRAASGAAGGDLRLEDENSLRSLIDSLLKERSGATSAKK